MTLLDQLRAQLRAQLDQRAAHESAIDTLIAAVEARSDTNLTADEAAEMTRLRGEIRSIDEARPELEARIADLQARADARAEAERLAASIPTAPSTSELGNAAPRVHVRSEARTYNVHNDRQGRNFLRDIMRAHTMSDFGAGQRLERHMQEERVERAAYMAGIEQRDVGTSAFSGLTVPQYLTDLVAPKIRNKRPFADICRHIDLPPEGMTVNISRITTGTAVAVQSAEAGAVQETDADDTLLTVNVRTYAGQQDVSRQAIERASGADSVVIEDLIGAYHEALDSGIINDDGTSGTHIGIKNVSGNVAVTYTDASPTAAELHPKLADLLQQISSGVDDMTHFLMHTRRWWWLASQLGSTFPLVEVGNAGVQQVGRVGGTAYAGTGRNYLGADVVLDRNISTTLGGGTEDAIYGVNANECFLWEDPNAPLLIRAEQTGAGNLLVKFVVYGYSAFTAGRYAAATGDITGTGLAAPTF